MVYIQNSDVKYTLSINHFRFIGLGRKFYYQEVPRRNIITNEEDIDYVYHMKGLSPASIDHFMRAHTVSITEIFEYLYNNNDKASALTFNLSETGVSFKYISDGIKTQEDFKRNIHFPEGQPPRSNMLTLRIINK